MFKVTVKTHQQCINISTLLWQHISVLLDHLQANIQRYEVHSVNHILWDPILLTGCTYSLKL
jgi:hypothetical protein